MKPHCGFEDHKTLNCHISPGEFRAAEKLGLDPEDIHFINEVYVESIVEVIKETSDRKKV